MGKQQDDRMGDFDFSKRADKYDDGFEGKASRRFYKLLLKEIALKPDARVLDVGCGTGALLNKLVSTKANRGNRIVCYGIDIEEAMLARAIQNYPDMSFQLARSDTIPFDSQSMDVLISCMAYHHFDNKQGFVKEAARVLKPGGFLYIADPRFPWPVRKVLNGIARIAHVSAGFYKSKELETQFHPVGFTLTSTAKDMYAQVVILQRDE